MIGDLSVYATSAWVALLRQDPSDQALWAALCQRTSAGHLAVFDACVRGRIDGFEASVERVAWLLEQARALADELARRRDAVPATRAEIAARTEWRRSADARAAVYNARAMRLELPLRGGRVTVALEHLQNQIGTSCYVRFEGPFASRIGARKKQSAFAGLFAHDALVGDPVFDALYMVQAHEPDEVHADLRSPARRALLTRIASNAVSVGLSESSLWWTVANPLVTAAELDAHAAMAAAVCDAFSMS